MSVDDLRGVEWLNGVGRFARDECVVADMQCEDVVKSIRGLMDNPKCLWLQVNVSGGGWAPYDAPATVDDGYMAAGVLGEVEASVGDAVAPPPAPQVALTIRDVAGEVGLPWDDNGGDSDSDVDMGSSPLAVSARRGRVGSGERWAGRAGSLVEPVVLLPAVPVLGAAVGRPSRGRTIPDSVDVDDSESG